MKIKQMFLNSVLAIGATLIANSAFVEQELYNGGSDGGERGGWYIAMRTAFDDAVIVSLDSTTVKAQLFHLKNSPWRGGNQGQADGLNVDYVLNEWLSTGGTYMIIDDNQPGTDDLSVYDARAEWAALPGRSLSGEIAHEHSADIDALAYYLQVTYSFTSAPWTPALTYRYANFDEDFRYIAYGVTDYGYWVQVEIAGNYPLANSNLKSNMVRVAPLTDVTLNLIYYDFRLPEPTLFAQEVTSRDFGRKINLALDWQASKRLALNVALGWLKPGKAAKQWTGGSEDRSSAIFYLSYTL
ncbi:MAG: hypothetical protein O3A63_02020 [Proteobacteria bacterium]|nr:hypothetical protein [Pseudomonadota bacterium]